MQDKTHSDEDIAQAVRRFLREAGRIIVNLWPNPNLKIFYNEVLYCLLRYMYKDTINWRNIF